MATNTRRAAKNRTPQGSVRTVEFDYGWDTISELAKNDPIIENQLKAFGWTGDNIFIIAFPPSDTSNDENRQNISKALRATANGTTCFQIPFKWKWRFVTGRKINSMTPYMPCYPFDISTENGKKADEARVNCLKVSLAHMLFPEQIGQEYKFGSGAREVGPTIALMQYFIMVKNVSDEILHTDPRNPEFAEAVRTLYLLRRTIQNFKGTEMYQDADKKIGNENDFLTKVQSTSEKICTLLLNRDTDLNSATQFWNLMIETPPRVFFTAWRHIAFGAVDVRDKNGQTMRENGNLMSSSQFFDRSIFKEGETVLLSILLENDIPGCLSSFNELWIARVINDALRHVPAINMSGITSLDEAIKKLHEGAGKGMETSLRSGLFLTMLMKCYFTGPMTSVKNTINLVSKIRNDVSSLQGITPLCMTLCPELLKFKNFDEVIADIILKISKDKIRKRVQIPLELLTCHTNPSLVRDLVNENIKLLQEAKDRLSSAIGKEEETNDNDKMDDDQYGQVLVSEKMQEWSKNYSSHFNTGNTDLVQSVVFYITALAQSQNLVALKAAFNKIPFIGIKKKQKIVRHVLERLLAKGDITIDKLRFIYHKLGMKRGKLDTHEVQDVGYGKRTSNKFVVEAINAMGTTVVPTKVTVVELPNFPTIAFVSMNSCIERQIALNKDIQIITETIQALFECPICAEDDLTENDMVVICNPLHDRICRNCSDNLRQRHERCPFCRANLQ